MLKTKNSTWFNEIEVFKRLHKNDMTNPEELDIPRTWTLQNICLARLLFIRITFKVYEYSLISEKLQKKIALVWKGNTENSHSYGSIVFHF